MSSSRFILACLLILLVALAIRVSVSVWWQRRLESSSSQFAMGDSESYWFLARQIAGGKPYYYNTPESSIFRTPGYPMLLSSIVDISDPKKGVLAARIMGCLFGTVAVAVCMCVATTLFSKSAALLCGVLCAFYPGGITTSVLVLSEAPFMPIMVLTVYCLVQSTLNSKHATPWTIAAGVLSGVAILIRPSWLLFMPFYYLIRILVVENRWQTLRQALIAGFAIMLVMAPWWLRNYQITHHLVLTTLQTGASLYDGLHPEATGGSDSGMEFTGQFADLLRKEDAIATGMDEGKYDNFEYRLNAKLASAAMNWAKEHPTRVLQLSFVKLYKTWWPFPSAEELPGGWTTRFVFASGMLVIMIPACFYVVSRSSEKTALMPLLLPTLYFTLLHMVFVGSIRYRQPAVFLMTVLAAQQLLLWYQTWIEHRKWAPLH